MYDLNWLLSAIAQCTATIVAILGGFIVTRLISISTERRVINSQLSDIGKEIKFKKEYIDQLDDDLLDRDAKYFIEDVIEDLIDRKSIDQIDILKKGRGRNEEELKAYWNEAIQYRDDAAKYFQGMGRSLQHFDFNEFAKSRKINPYGIEYLVWDSVFSDSLKKTGSKIQNIRIANDAVTIEFVKQYRSIKDKISDEQNKLDWRCLQKEALESRVALLNKPKGMLLGLFVFCSFSGVGIILPLSFIPYAPAASVNSLMVVKWFTIGMFSIGLLFVVAYLISFLRSEKVKEKE